LVTGVHDEDMGEVCLTLRKMKGFVPRLGEIEKLACSNNDINLILVFCLEGIHQIKGRVSRSSIPDDDMGDDSQCRCQCVEDTTGLIFDHEEDSKTDLLSTHFLFRDNLFVARDIFSGCGVRTKLNVCHETGIFIDEMNPPFRRRI
jgi:hypothetical protein